MSVRSALLAATIGAAVGLAPPAGAETVRTAVGPADLTRPERVAVYDIAALDTLTTLGITVAGVPNTLFLPWLEEKVAGADIVGSLFEPDLEALNAAEPDLVIVGNRSSTMVADTARVAETVDMTIDGEHLIDDALARIEDYGALFGKEAAAEAAIAAIETALGKAKAAAEGKGNALIVLTNGPKFSVYGENSRFGWLHRDIGIPPAAEGLSSAIHGEAVSFEFIAETNPDWLIVLDRAAAIGSGEQSARATLDNALVAETTAWQTGQVIYLPAAEFYISPGGATSLVTILDALADGLSGGAGTGPVRGQ